LQLNPKHAQLASQRSQKCGPDCAVTSHDMENESPGYKDWILSFAANPGGGGFALTLKLAPNDEETWDWNRSHCRKHDLQIKLDLQIRMLPQER
jgi:hypothetical protein